MTCSLPECQTSAGCAHRGPQGQMCWFPPVPLGGQHSYPQPPILSPVMGCICPGDATPYCKNPLCPRKNPLAGRPSSPIASGREGS